MIRVSGLVKYYGDRCAVAGVDFEVEKGHVVGFLGLNGAGKTTILRMLAGDLEPSAGTIHVDGRDLLADPGGYRKAVGFLPETVPLYLDMTVTEYLDYVGRLRSASGDLSARIHEVCEQVDIADHAHLPIRHLSHGYRKRLGIASAIVHNPDLVILDEAISGLDPVQIVEMRSVVRSLAGSHTVLVSSHILTEISQTCDEILVMRAGRIAARGTESELLARLTSAADVEVRVRGAAEAASETVRGIEGVQGVTTQAVDDGTVSLTVSASEDVREEIVRRLVAANLGVLRIDRASGELETAFLQMTKEVE